ncbi:biotin transporter BioY [Metabacillus idriensis]|uniref:Biotin transporter n=1 Tax=Metabacillus idriensis TaxID=324768 RepID=A0A6I2MBA8_9BACI|nr:biotin transporter BioY [Metabacillus idriensis]MCM3596467.1 biotin transporter BioY [Metabacillus idriensis]MRX55448.1 biotin transporter BioY [Metabacillus idriensis]OHR68363.1 biotin biosynthesis protein BioY [Bacillus sp. HMSC76G11]
MKRSLSVYSISVVSMFAALTAVGAFIKIPMPVIPFTLQILFVYLAGALLGSKLGAMSQMLYIGIGLAGLPVFSSGGGLSYIFQPTFGYLIGFAAASFVIGYILERCNQPKLKHFLFAHFTGLIIVYLFGVGYLYLSLNTWIGTGISFSAAFYSGFLLSVFGDLLLCFGASLLSLRLYKSVPRPLVNVSYSGEAKG